MMAKLNIFVRDTKRVSRKLATALHDLTLPTGTMWRAFLDARDRKVGKVYVATLNGRPVGWLLQRPTPPWEPDGTDDAKLFVDPAYRRRGIGTVLLREAEMESSGRMVVYPWDNCSDGFFARVAPARAIFCEDWSKRGVDITRLAVELPKFTKGHERAVR